MTAAAARTESLSPVCPSCQYPIVVSGPSVAEQFHQFLEHELSGLVIAAGALVAQSCQSRLIVRNRSRDPPVEPSTVYRAVAPCVRRFVSVCDQLQRAPRLPETVRRERTSIRLPKHELAGAQKPPFSQLLHEPRRDRHLARLA